MPKCDQCSKLLSNDTYHNEYGEDQFCSDRCAEQFCYDVKEDLLKHEIGYLSRDQIINILEAHDIQCYDGESDEVLREALLVNVMDGTIDEVGLN